MFTKSTIVLLASLLANIFFSTAQAAACGDAVTSDITLTADLHCSSGFTALEVFANNVTIDLNGHILSGTSDLAGILMHGYKNLTVTNGSILGFYAGVNVNHTTSLKVNNITFYDLGSGVSSNAGNNAIIEKNKFIRTDTGIAISNNDAETQSNNNLINNNEFYQARIGIQICGAHADYNAITNNLIWKTKDYGIHLIQSDNSKIVNNRILETDDTAIRLSDSSYSTIKTNTLKEGRTGLSILASATTPCMMGTTGSYKNNVTGNYLLEFKTGIQLGLGQSSSAQVLINSLKNNKVYDDDVGILFETDAHDNITANGYQGTTTPIIDYGVNNTY